MPLPTVESIEELHELEDLLRPYLEGRAYVTLQELSENVVTIRPHRDDISAVFRVMPGLGFNFDVLAKRFNYEDPVEVVNEEHSIRVHLRYVVQRAIKSKGRKGDEYVAELGCTIRQFRRWIEGQFEDGMSWENWGRIWHADHIRPLSLFDLRDRKQYLAASHWSNVRPMWVSRHRHRPRKR